ncbi:MAG: FAD-dependent oxidoreductase, partial [Candidatus Thorarchaeota archaeon]
VIEKLDIKVELNTPLSKEAIEDFNPNLIVLATGIKPKKPEIKGIEKIKYHNFIDVLKGRIPKGQKIAVLGGDMIGIEIAEYLSFANKEVIIISEKKRLGTDLYSLVAREVLQTIEEDDKIEIKLETEIKEINENELIALQNNKRISINFDDVITTSVEPSIDIENIAKENVEKVFKIGDCKETHARKIVDSISEGYELGLIIETPEADLLYADILELEEGDLKSLIKMKMKRRTFTNNDIPDYLQMMVQICNEDEKIRKKNKKTQLLFQIKIGEDRNYYIKIENGQFSAGESKVEKANVTICMDESIASGIFMGTINAASAYMAKELKFEGSMIHGMKFRTLTDTVIKKLENT